MSGRTRNDLDLDNFLKRVEHIDENNGSNMKTVPVMKYRSEDSYRRPREDIEKARRLLDGDDMSHEMVVDNSDYNDSDLMYKSAYNYEKIVSPTKPNYSIKDLDLQHISDRTKGPSNVQSEKKLFTVTEGDYLLLQRLKKNALVNEDDEVTPNKTIKRSIPSRGKPRQENVKLKDTIEIDMDAPSLPPRRVQNLVESDEEHNDVYEKRFNRIQNRSTSPAAPQLPSRRLVADREIIHIDSESDDDESPKPELPVRMSKIIENKKESKPEVRPRFSSKVDLKLKTQPKHEVDKPLKKKIEIVSDDALLVDFKESSNFSSHQKSGSIVESISKPEIKPKPIALTNQKDLTKSQNDDNKSEDIGIHGKNNSAVSLPASRKLKEPISFLSSLSNNKLSVSHINQPETPTKRKSNISIDYLDSVQLKSPSPHNSPSPSPKRSPIIPLKSKLPRSESFINSALKSNIEQEKKTIPTTKEKPILPSKPKKLQNDYITVDEHKDENSELKSFKLKPTKNKDTTYISPKIAPNIPLKNNNIVLPSLRTADADVRKSTSQNSRTDQHNIELPKLRSVNGDQSDKKKSTRPDVPKREPTIPEALLKGRNLRKSKINEQDDENTNQGLPEALVKKNNLQKSKIAPNVPERKISMPEALKRASMLRNKNNASPPREDSTLESDTKPEETIKNKLESIMLMQQRKTFGGNSSPNLQPPIRRSKTTVSETNLTSKESSASLVHVTKNRARGPKRKLPTKRETTTI